MDLLNRLRILINDLRDQQICLLSIIEGILERPATDMELLQELRGEFSSNQMMIFRLVVALWDTTDTKFDGEDQVYAWLNEAVGNDKVRQYRVGINSKALEQFVEGLVGEKE